MEHPNSTALPEEHPNRSGEFSKILNTMNLAAIAFLLDENLSILWANEQFLQKTGYLSKDYQYHFQTLRQYYAEYPNDFALLKSEVDCAKKDGIEITVRLPQKNGLFSWSCLSIAFVKNDADGPTQCYAVCKDSGKAVSPEAEEQQLLKKRASYFRWMLDEYMGNAYIADMQTYELLYLNQSSFELLGLTPKEVLGRKCYEVIQGRSSPCPFCTNKLLTEDTFYEWEFFNPLLGRTFLIKNRVVDWNGRRARLELSHDNYSLEYKLTKKDREREAILRTIPGGFARVDARDLRTVLWYGGEFLQLIGYTKEQFESELHSQCTYMHPDDIDRAASIMQHSRETGEHTIIEGRIITRSGTIKILTITYSYVSGEDSWDGIASFYSVGIDVTQEREEQARQRKALEDAYQAARVASLAKTNFLSSMSHDIRTPMNAILGMSAIAQTNLQAPDKIRNCLNKIDTSSRHLLSLINEVLDMSKIESGKIDLTLEEVNLSNLLQSITDMCRPLIEEKQHRFEISIGQVRHETVITDGDRLQQILMNLLSNAIKYTPAGGVITLRINELHQQGSEKSQYEFICTDNGIGISREYLPLVFEPFWRAEDPRISKLQGTGLGMTITENIVRMMNGTIDVQSELGVGSSFTVSVPLTLCLEKEACCNELQGLPVLVVDDDPITCENAAALLNELGMQGFWVLSGMEAVNRVVEAHNQNQDFFAVIIDWKMPEMDGLDTVKAIRKKLGKNVPIIIISAYDYSDIEEQFLQAGADAFITKPLFKSKMLQVLHVFLSTGSSSTTEAEEQKSCPMLSGKRVLLVEDNDINREILMELLQMQNIVVDSVENGQKALDTFEASSPGEYDAILMDIQMPVLNGYQATEAIRSLNRSDAQTIPIFALTADAFAADVAKARSAGMNGHIAKPIEINHLLEVLQKWIC
ncbi:PAS domain-containing hybrid sensor histidine kinase/response regulator [Anaeromassilibacillus senegalensis]|uniref:PAS domain-containing hybrid sensor histidine kinase/response regulator n=1 Tax=Anaeromassilibacillus senegalensis TaxID=1673717 RepID=UPI000680424C|nr:response regulator [Anaeromassilibacillus senegalensis]